MSNVSLYILAHPDDEYFCSQQIRNDVSASRRPVIIYLTDGSELSADIREVESTRALMKLGVERCDIRFVGRKAGGVDGRLYTCMQPVYEAMIEELQGIEEQIVTVRCMAWEGGHQDHDVGHVIAATYATEHLRHSAMCIQFPLYNGMGVTGQLFKVHNALPQNGPINIVVADSLWRSVVFSRHYPSQWKTWVGLTPLFTLQLLRGRGFAEQMVSKDRLFQRPHEGALLYERRFNTSYIDVRRSIDRFIQQFSG